MPNCLLLQPNIFLQKLLHNWHSKCSNMFRSWLHISADLEGHPEFEDSKVQSSTWKLEWPNPQTFNEFSEGIQTKFTPKMNSVPKLGGNCSADSYGFVALSQSLQTCEHLHLALNKLTILLLALHFSDPFSTFLLCLHLRASCRNFSTWILRIKPWHRTSSVPGIYAIQIIRWKNWAHTSVKSWIKSNMKFRISSWVGLTQTLCIIIVILILINIYKYIHIGTTIVFIILITIAMIIIIVVVVVKYLVLSFVRSLVSLLFVSITMLTTTTTTATATAATTAAAAATTTTTAHTNCLGGENCYCSNRVINVHSQNRTSTHW